METRVEIPDDAPIMLIRFTKLTNDRHRFEVIRDTGARESRELETRSFLLHDLVHYAVETEANLNSVFYGQLHAGRTIDEITQMPSPDPEAMQAERIVAQIQGASKMDDWASADPAAFATTVASSLRAIGDEPPLWLTPDFITRVRDNLRRVQGQWRATPFHQTMELRFPVPPERAR